MRGQVGVMMPVDPRPILSHFESLINRRTSAMKSRLTTSLDEDDEYDEESYAYSKIESKVDSNDLTSETELTMA